MIGYWSRALIVTGVIGALFAVLLGTDEFEEGDGRRSHGLAFMIRAVRAAIVDPLGLPLSTAILCACVLAVFGFFALGKRPAEESHAPLRYNRAANGEAVEQALASARKSFGTRIAAAPPRIANEEARIARDVLSTRSFDWYFAHYGYEGNWRKAAGQLRAMGEEDLAQIIEFAGRTYEPWQEQFLRSDGEPTQEQTNRYFAEMEPADRRRIAYFAARAA